LAKSHEGCLKSLKKSFVLSFAFLNSFGLNLKNAKILIDKPPDFSVNCARKINKRICSQTNLSSSDQVLKKWKTLNIVESNPKAIKMRITEVNRFSDFIALEERWRKVLQQSSHTIFQTWEWLSTWWRYFGNGKRLLILLAEENEEIVGIAPLMYSVYTKSGARQGVIEFIGAGHSEYNDFILTDKSKKSIHMFFDYLNNLTDNWSCAKFADIVEKRGQFSPLRQISDKMLLGRTSLILALPKSYEGLLYSVKGRDKKDFKRNLRRLDENGFKVDLVDYSSETLLTKGMNTLFDLHQKRWRSKGGFRGMFAEQNFRDFSLNIAKCFSQEGWLGLYCLELSGKPAAAILGFKYLSTYYLYISGLDPIYCKYSIGNLLYWLVMPRFIQEELVEFDFGIGTDAYKRQWNPIEKRAINFICLRRDDFAISKYWLYEKYYKATTLITNILKIRS